MHTGYIDNSIRWLFKITQKQLLGIIAVEAFFAILAMFLPWYVPFLMILFAFIILILLKWPEYSLIPIALFFTVFNVRLALISESRVVDYAVPMDIIAIFSGIAVILGKVTKKLPVIEPSPIYIPMLASVGFALISNLWSPTHYYSTLFSIKLISCVFIFFCGISLVNKQKTIEMLCWIFLIMGVITALAGYYSTIESQMPKIKTIPLGFSDLGIMYNFLIAPHSRRASGLAHPNTVSFCINTAIFFGFILFFNAKNSCKKYIIASVLIILLMGNILTFSKAGIISLIVGMPVFVMILPQLKGRRIITGLLYFAVFVAVVLFVIVVIQGGDPGKFAKDPTSMQSKASLGSRLILWDKGLDVLLDSYGIGPGIGGMMKYVLGGSNMQSVYFSILFDLGLVGFLLFSWLAIVYVLEIYRALKECKNDFYKTFILSISTLMLVFSIHATMEFEIYTRMSWFLAGLLFRAAQLSIKSTQQH